MKITLQCFDLSGDLIAEFEDAIESLAPPAEIDLSYMPHKTVRVKVVNEYDSVMFDIAMPSATAVDDDLIASPIVLRDLAAPLFVVEETPAAHIRNAQQILVTTVELQRELNLQHGDRVAAYETAIAGANIRIDNALKLLEECG
jgi:hypothetical protein